MSIQSEIDRIEQNVANTYSVLAEVGAPMPASMDSDNLAGTAANISAVLYNKAQSLTNNQQAQGRNNINAITGSDLTLAIGADGLLYIFAKGVQVGTGIDIATAGDIIGYVDANNNVILKGNLADGTYSIQYEMENGNTVNIGNLVLDTRTYYTVTNNLTQCTNNNSATKIAEGESYSATITAKSGYQLKSVSATMGGNTVSVSNGKINISSVTGNIVITAVAEETAAEPTNFCVVGGDGWITNGRCGSDGTDRTDAGSDAILTNYIAVQNGDVVYVENMDVYAAGNAYSGIYNADKTAIKGFLLTSGYTSYITVNNATSGQNQFTIANVNAGYVRICGKPLIVKTSGAAQATDRYDCTQIFIKIKRNGEWL